MIGIARSGGRATRTGVLALLALTWVASAGCEAQDDSASAQRPTRSKTPVSDSTPTPPVPNATERELARGGELLPSVQAYSDAFLTGDAAASRALLSQRCRKRVSASEWKGIVAQAGREYGTALKIRTYDAEVSGDLARVSYTYAIAKINQDEEPWVRERGRWLEDDC